MNILCIESPLGLILLASNGRFLKRLAFIDDPIALTQHTQATDGILEKTQQQIDEWLHGQRQVFDIPCAPDGTDFQKRVWSALLTIPFGTTCSYKELARKVGRPTAARAVGAANGQNPIALIIPCHRVIGSDGSLTGYAFGIQRKQRLLELESGKHNPLAATRPQKALF